MPKGVYKRTPEMKIGKFKRTVEMNRNNSIAQIKRYEDPKEHEKISITTKKGLADPKVKIKHKVGSKKGHNTPEAIVNYSVAKIGEKNPNYQGGLTPLYQILRDGLKSKQWTKDVFIRDHFTCQKCGDNSGGNLEAHHIKPFIIILFENNIVTYEDGINCVEFWNINNGITLCKKCHKKEQVLTMKQIKRARKDFKV